MPKYSITLRREMAEIAISVTEFDSGKIIYKSGFFGSTDYKYDEKFTELSQMFIKYAHDSVIQLRNEDRYFTLLNNLLDDKVIDIEKIQLEEETNTVKIYGGVM